MNKSITLTLNDEEMMELQRIIIDDDKDEALSFVKRHFKNKVRAGIMGEGQCQPDRICLRPESGEQNKR
ncbi:MAG: hypothetical protein Q7T04_00160 [Dehalococcoidia bacterium]|nr:hypothetical protein [Dehalococcoidia bacterium]